MYLSKERPIRQILFGFTARMGGAASQMCVRAIFYHVVGECQISQAAGYRNKSRG
jgi:hypothetical protein